MLSRSVSRLYRMALRGRGQGITCFTSSFRAYKADVLRSVEFEADDFLANAEILVRVLLAEHRVIEMASRLHVRKTGASKMRIFRTIGRHLGLLRRLLADGLDVSWKAGPEDTEPDTALK
jgi:hypothetical protein